MTFENAAASITITRSAAVQVLGVWEINLGMNLDPNVWRMIAGYCTVQTAIRLASTCVRLHRHIDTAARAAPWLALRPDERLVRAAVERDYYLLRALLTHATCKGWALYKSLLADVAAGILDRVQLCYATAEEMIKPLVHSATVGDSFVVSVPGEGVKFVTLKYNTLSACTMALLDSDLPMTTVRDLTKDVECYTDGPVPDARDSASNGTSNGASNGTSNDKKLPPGSYTYTISNIVGAVMMGPTLAYYNLYYEAAAFGDLEFMKSAQENIRRLSYSTAVRIFRHAAQYNHVQILNWGYNFHPDAINCAITSAVAGGAIDAINWYWERDPTVVEGSKHVIAAWHGQLEMLKYLAQLNSYRNISSAAYDICSAAIARWHSSIIQYMVSCGLTPRLSRLLILARKHKCNDIITLLEGVHTHNTHNTCE